MRPLFLLFIVFCKIGLFSFGGGLAMVPLFVVEFEHRGWMTADQFFDVLTLAQVTPGAIAMNAATYVGNDVHGVLGAVFATMGLASPSIVIVLILAGVLKKYKENRYKKAFLFGMKPITLALILFAGWVIAKETFFTTGFTSPHYSSLALFGGCVVLLYFFPKIHPVAILLLASLAGLLFL
ncbi:chromate transporter [Limibacter armeniacum]|uniref:chromate transporter n=1 Tax=Limibacter armeniacum TaxID=466084 RepID=UPI002FE582F4